MHTGKQRQKKTNKIRKKLISYFFLLLLAVVGNVTLKTKDKLNENHTESTKATKYTQLNNEKI